MPVVIGEALARKLSDQIIYLHLAPGAHLTEDDICREYAVSRSPVREAFRALEADGLVLRLARRGVRVRPIGRRDLDEVYACRVVLEGLAAREAARNASEAMLGRMHALLQQMQKTLRAGQVRPFFESNVALTSAIHEASANQALIRIAGGIEKQALRYRYLAHSRTQEMLKASLEGHGRVLEAIAARNPARAEQVGKASLRQAQRVIRGVIDTLTPEETGQHAGGVGQGPTGAPRPASSCAVLCQLLRPHGEATPQPRARAKPSHGAPARPSPTARRAKPHGAPRQPGAQPRAAPAGPPRQPDQQVP